jgi:hypothetical protein
MKTAILLIGGIRTWDKCKENFKEVFKNCDYDVFVSTYTKKWIYHPFIKNSLNFNTEEILTKDQILNLFCDVNPKTILIDDVDQITEETKSKSNEIFKNHHYSLCQFLKIKKIMDCVRKEEHDTNKKYDKIIKTRCDLFLNSFPDVDYECNILIDKGNVFPNDCIFATNSISFENIINFIMNEIENPTMNNNLENMPHTLFLNSINANNIKIITHDLVKFVSRATRDDRY